MLFFRQCFSLNFQYLRALRWRLLSKHIAGVLSDTRVDGSCRWSVNTCSVFVPTVRTEAKRLHVGVQGHVIHIFRCNPRQACCSGGGVGCSCRRRRSQSSVPSQLGFVQGMCVSRPRTLGGRREGERESALQLAAGGLVVRRTQRSVVKQRFTRREGMNQPQLSRTFEKKTFLNVFYSSSFFPIFGTFDFCNQQKYIIIQYYFTCTRRQQHPE